VFERCDDAVDAVDTPIGRVPAPGTLPTEGLDMTEEQLAAALAVHPDEWTAQMPQVHQHFAQFGDGLPQPLRDELAALERRLEQAG
jgi:phosphoenolpyruvate carboxykinase (GTP)